MNFFRLNALVISCVRGRHNMPPPRPAMEARSGSLSQAEPGLISQYASSSRPAAHAARRPDVRHRRQTDVRQHHRLMPPARGHNNSGKRTKCLPLIFPKRSKVRKAKLQMTESLIFGLWTLGLLKIKTSSTIVSILF